MALSCELHTAYIYDRGGRRQIGLLEPMIRIKWNRTRDDVSAATLYVSSPGIECSKMLGITESGRHEVVIFRGDKRVWEGPVVRISYMGQHVEIEAHDVMQYAARTIMHNEYDNRYPNNGKVLDRIKRIMTAELARKEACDPAYNILPHVRYIYSTDPTVKDANTAAHTEPYEYTVFQHIDNYAARGGLDYTVLGRSIMFFDVHQKIGQTAMVTADDFLGDPVITQYGMELGTRVAMTNGKGVWGAAGGIDPFYGEWELLHQAYDESAGPTDPADEPTKAELESQARRAWQQSKLPPLVARIPDNTALNPNGVLTIDDLVPGTWIPLSVEVPGRTVQQMQKLDKMSVEETAQGGEVIKVVLSPAYTEEFVEEDEA
jgi:hypothetical protein